MMKKTSLKRNFTSQKLYDLDHKKVSILKYIVIYCLPYLYLHFVKKIPSIVQILLFPFIIVGFILDTLCHALIYATFRLTSNCKLKKAIVTFYQKYYDRLQAKNEHKKNLVLHIHDDDHNCNHDVSVQ